MSWNVQVATSTSNNRYPGIFRTVQRRVAERLGANLGEGSLKILSFGCSNGSEVATLRSYFPEALIYACDINVTALHAATELLLMDEAIIFLSSPTSIAEHGPFDVIFAMSVLCRFPESLNTNITNLSSLYRFEEFESTAELLAKGLRQHGIICFYNTNYNFRHTAIARHFRVIRSPLVASNGFVDHFDPDGERATWCEHVGQFYVHRPRQSEVDYMSCIFEASDEQMPLADALVPFGDPPQAQLKAPPDFMRFGPDLSYCAERKLVATAMGYWLQKSAANPFVVRAWSRTTPDGVIEHGTPWAASITDATMSVLATSQTSLLPPLPQPSIAKRIFGALRSVNDRFRLR